MDRQLEMLSQNWADRCMFEHQMRGYGENLAFISSTGPTPDPGYVIRESIRQWYNERPLYRFGRGSCGAACHYTQVQLEFTIYFGYFACPKISGTKTTSTTE